MGIQLLRYQDVTGHRWAVVEGDSARPLETAFETTGDVLTRGVPALLKHEERLGAAVPLGELEVLSPVTRPCRVIAQATNYRDHVLEVGLEPSARTSNVLFTKSSASISGPHDDIVRPPHVRLLDYELELALVIGRDTEGPQQVDAVRLSDFVAALVVANDVSARDVQVPDGQFYKGKSFRGFCPLGPYLFVPTEQEWSRWPELRLTLRVNGEVRQDALAGQMIHRPAETLTELTTYEDLTAGDVVLTGTPGGVALASPKKPLRALAELLPEAVKWRKFIEGQARNPRYLKPGDRLEATIRTPDGRIDLGTQHNIVR